MLTPDFVEKCSLTVGDLLQLAIAGSASRPKLQKEAIFFPGEHAKSNRNISYLDQEVQRNNLWNVVECSFNSNCNFNSIFVGKPAVFLLGESVIYTYRK